MRNLGIYPGICFVSAPLFLGAIPQSACVPNFDGPNLLALAIPSARSPGLPKMRI